LGLRAALSNCDLCLPADPVVGLRNARTAMLVILLNERSTVKPRGKYSLDCLSLEDFYQPRYAGDEWCRPGWFHDAVLR
jgi:hypothetical protein